VRAGRPSGPVRGHSIQRRQASLARIGRRGCAPSGCAVQVPGYLRLRYAPETQRPIYLGDVNATTRTKPCALDECSESGSRA
jgi:hypothetical protein